jgi:hypothetical protein
VSRVVIAFKASDHDHRMEDPVRIVIAAPAADADHGGARVVNRLGIRGVDGVVRSGLHHDCGRLAMAANHARAKNQGDEHCECPTEQAKPNFLHERFLSLRIVPGAAR